MSEKMNVEKPNADNFGKDFGDSFKTDSDFGKSFSDSFKKDTNFGKDFANSFKGSIADGFSRQDTPPLSDDDKAKIKEETGWPDEIVDNIATMEEYEIYKEAGLVAVEINGKWCLMRSDIDWDQKDESGRTNRERVNSTPPYSPINKNGEVVELHHIGQKADSPLAELTHSEHRQNGNDSVLHDKNQKTEAHTEENEPKFREEKKEHWIERSKMDEK